LPTSVSQSVASRRECSLKIRRLRGGFLLTVAKVGYTRLRVAH